MLCPYCGSETEHDEVDIGVGMLQCSPVGCPYCHSFEMGPDDDMSKATEEEKRKGWWKGDRSCAS